jgi:hypothetical protein
VMLNGFTSDNVQTVGPGTWNIWNEYSNFAEKRMGISDLASKMFSNME